MEREDANMTTSVSTMISNLMSMDGINSFNFSLYRARVYLFELLQQHLHDHDILASGSFAEGSQIIGSDVDQMWVMSDTMVTKQDYTPDRIKGHHFIMETTSCRPGFSKLFVAETDNSARNAKFMNQWCQDVEGKLYLSSEKYTEFNLDLLSGTEKFSTIGRSDTKIFRHGPCATINYKDFGTESDIALAVRCLSWPSEADEWITRARASDHQWPSAKLINRIKLMPCYLLPIGDPESTSCSIEWRFAFVPTERELVWSFNDSQLQCYVLLKMLKKKFIDPLADDQLSSFHLKTVMFWISEELGLEIWNVNNLIKCIVVCLGRVESCLKRLVLPHYILKDRNLLHSKFANREDLDLVLKMVAEIRHNPVASLMECFKDTESLINSILQECPSSEDVVAFLESSSKYVPDTMDLKDSEARFSCQKTFETYLFSMILPTSVDNIMNAVEAIDLLPEDLNQIVVENTRKYLVIRAGSQILAEACVITDLEKKKEMLSVAYDCFNSSKTIDGLAGQLHLATFHYMTGHFDEVFKLLGKTSFQKGVMYYCKSGHFMRNIEGLQLVKTDTGQIVKQNKKVKVLVKTVDSEGKIGQQIVNQLPVDMSTTFCDVMFTSSDVTAVPDAIKFECALLGENMNWNFCTIHSLFYAHYIRFEIAFQTADDKERNKTLQRMALTITNTEPDYEWHRLLNIIGYCYLKCGETNFALVFFILSLEKQPTTGNAAVYHLCMLISKLLNE